MEKEFVKNIGDIVWLMYNNKVAKGNVSTLKYVKTTSPVDFDKITEDEIYEVKDGETNFGFFHLDKLFNTKEDLIKSL